MNRQSANHRRLWARFNSSHTAHRYAAGSFGPGGRCLQVTLLFLVLFATPAWAQWITAPAQDPHPHIGHTPAHSRVAHTDPAISSDGRFVAFQSDSTALLPDIKTTSTQIYVYGREKETLTCVSVDDNGRPGNWISFNASISADGRFVAFVSSSTNLVPGDTNEKEDVFVHDRKTGRTLRISVDSMGGQADGSSRDPSISDNGGYVAFVSTADNLVQGDTNAAADVFLYDLKNGKTSRISVDSSGTEANAGSGEPAISRDGRFVAFSSHANNLVPDDTNGKVDVFIHEVRTGITRRVSESSSGTPGNADSRHPAISGDGRYVVFESWASNLVSGDGNNAVDIFAQDRRTGLTTLVSVNSSGKQGHGDSRDPRVSEKGRYVLFTSFAKDMVSNDTENWGDVFVHDRESKKTTRMSVSSEGAEGNHDSAQGSISGDGQVVTFASKASNLVPQDTNQSVDVFVHDRRTGQTARIAPPPPDPNQRGGYCPATDQQLRVRAKITSQEKGQ